ncbi:hypothetical protein E6O75_ATG01790 [Venturia nashicola]|uniref:Uncharacterized protein n=1 Tax=Venturia nashicola TaxID=86259 RepID=A0A4Z1NJ20_9PEZI|nr:hypothetical protein E6O75_ATG01790 [Venturia nashicola]
MIACFDNPSTPRPRKRESIWTFVRIKPYDTGVLARTLLSPHACNFVSGELVLPPTTGDRRPTTDDRRPTTDVGMLQ